MITKNTLYINGTWTVDMGPKSTTCHSLPVGTSFA